MRASKRSTALREVTSRKRALGGRSGRSPSGEYPLWRRIETLILPRRFASEQANVVRVCLRGKGYSVPQELAAIWISEDIESVIFPSATGVGRNVAVYLANAGAGSVMVRNRAEVLAALRPTTCGEAWPVAVSF